jgi:hypothetical protein
MPGGPIYIQEHELPEYYFGDANQTVDEQPLTQGRLIGGLISTALLIGTGIYLVFAW